MRSAVAFYVIATGCGGSHAVIADTNTDVPVADAPHDTPLCVASSGGFPRPLQLTAAGTEGAGDPSFAGDLSGRTWMSYSAVDPGPGDLRLVSTRLAYTDDGGATFCDAGVTNAAELIATPPSELSGIAAYWVHEVSTLDYDAAAPADERWRLAWHRYILANTGASDERQFQYSWISEKRAGSPEALATATEHKLLAAAGYAASSAAQAYNDSVIGPVETRVDQLDPALADCVVLTEPGAYSTPDARWLAIECGTPNPATTRMVLLADARAGAWRFASRLLGQSEARHINVALDGFGAGSLFVSGGTTYLSATPSVGGIYKGCIGFAIALPAGTLIDGNRDGQPDPRFALMGATDFSGACDFDASLTAVGIVVGQVDIAHNPPIFTLQATGVSP